MASRKTSARRQSTAGVATYLDVLRGWSPAWTAMPARLDSKLARARAQDEPVLYAHFLPGLDLLLCAVPGARAPYPPLSELRQRCVESVMHALEQPCLRLETGGCWYEHNGVAVLVFASGARSRALNDFGALPEGSNVRGDR